MAQACLGPGSVCLLVAHCQDFSFSLWKITGLLCQGPAPASPSLITRWACPLHPAWTLSDVASVGHTAEGCSNPAIAQPGLDGV